MFGNCCHFLRYTWPELFLLFFFLKISFVHDMRCPVVSFQYLWIALNPVKQLRHCEPNQSTPVHIVCANQTETQLRRGRGRRKRHGHSVAGGDELGYEWHIAVIVVVIVIYESGALFSDITNFALSLILFWNCCQKVFFFWVSESVSASDLHKQVQIWLIVKKNKNTWKKKKTKTCTLDVVLGSSSCWCNKCTFMCSI